MFQVIFKRSVSFHSVFLSGIYALKPALPAVGGNEGVGEVTEVGSEVQGLDTGDRVVLRAEQCLGTGGTFPLYPRILHIIIIDFKIHYYLNLSL